MFSLACNLTKNDAEFLPIEISSKKVRVNNMDFSARRNFVEKSMWSTWIFRPSKLHRKKYGETTWIFRPLKLRWKSMWEKRGYFDQRNHVKKSTWKQPVFFNQWSYTEKVSGNNLVFYHQNYVKKVCGNDVDFSTMKVTSKKICGNDLDILISEITLKKYVEMMWKFVEVWLLTYQRNIDVESTCIWRGVSIVYAFIYQTKDADFRPNRSW